jgi:hypothetical protein
LYGHVKKKKKTILDEELKENVEENKNTNDVFDSIITNIYDLGQ